MKHPPAIGFAGLNWRAQDMGAEQALALWTMGFGRHRLGRAPFGRKPREPVRFGGTRLTCASRRRIGRARRWLFHGLSCWPTNGGLDQSYNLETVDAGA